jgi:hypothetical protein
MYYFIVMTVSANGESEPSNEVRAMPDINIGTVVTVASRLSNPYGIAINSISVYWTKDCGTPVMSGPGTVKKVGINGGAVTILYSELSGLDSGPRSIAVDSTSVYWADVYGIRKIGDKRRERNDPCLRNKRLSMRYCRRFHQSTNVYWTEFTGNGSIYKVGINGGAFATVASGRGLSQNIAVDSTNVYWTEAVSETVNQVSKWRCTGCQLDKQVDDDNHELAVVKWKFIQKICKSRWEDITVAA